LYILSDSSHRRTEPDAVAAAIPQNNFTNRPRAPLPQPGIKHKSVVLRLLKLAILLIVVYRTITMVPLLLQLYFSGFVPSFTTLCGELEKLCTVHWANMSPSGTPPSHLGQPLGYRTRAQRMSGVRWCHRTREHARAITRDAAGAFVAPASPVRDERALPSRGSLLPKDPPGQLLYHRLVFRSSFLSPDNVVVSVLSDPCSARWCRTDVMLLLSVWFSHRTVWLFYRLALSGVLHLYNVAHRILIDPSGCVPLQAGLGSRTQLRVSLSSSLFFLSVRLSTGLRCCGAFWRSCGCCSWALHDSGYMLRISSASCSTWLSTHYASSTLHPLPPFLPCALE
jgi:hypothetical protein